jgi:uncharacterized protein (DUF58 family)
VRTEPRRGPGPEYLGVREYRPGDPIRQIHWRLTARHGELVVRDLEQERIPRVAIWVDTSGDEEALDARCTVAASLVDAATATGAGVRLRAPGPEGPIGATRARAVDLHRWLARLAVGDLAPARAVGQLDPGADALRAVGTLVVIAPPSIADAAHHLASLTRIVGRLVLVIPVDDQGALAPLPRDDRLLLAGIEVVPWIDGRGLADPLVRPVEVPV